MLRIGTAGWTIPRACADQFPADGSSLERYASRFRAAEINSTFHRLPRPQTILRWATQAPDRFSFAVKLPKAITHEKRLLDADDMLAAFLSAVLPLGDKLGPLLVQLPPSLAFSAEADAFLRDLRTRHAGPLVCEPRHASWFTEVANASLLEHRIARAAADPARVPQGEEPGGWPGLAYFRLHGSPRTYYSAYGASRLAVLAKTLLASPAAETWCIFDNTASGAALGDALLLAADPAIGLAHSHPHSPRQTEERG